jgi:hypothetical protein
MRDDIKDILNKQMTRKEFLRYAGGTLIVLLGLGNLLSFLKQPTRTVVQSPAEDHHGFGSRKFGA